MRARKCATCRKTLPRDAATFPFCSPRCRAADLHQWLEGAYAIPSFETPVPSPDTPREGPES